MFDSRKREWNFALQKPSDRVPASFSFVIISPVFPLKIKYKHLNEVKKCF